MAWPECALCPERATHRITVRVSAPFNRFERSSFLCYAHAVNAQSEPRYVTVRFHALIENCHPLETKSAS